jgi:Fic family protein
MEDKFDLTYEENVFVAKKLMAQSIYNSARIEGCNLTYPQTKTILDGMSVAGITMGDVQTVMNLRDAWRWLLGNLRVPLDLDCVCAINGYISRNESLEWGRLRTGRIGITGTAHEPGIPDGAQVAKDLAEIQRKPYVTESALDCFLYTVYNQLFWDGNKRTATLVANKILIGAGKGILSIPESGLDVFNRLLSEYYGTAKPDALKRFLYDSCVHGLRYGNKNYLA